MEEVVFDTNQLIDASRKDKFDLQGLTTIFNVIEFPNATKFEELTVLYPTLEDFQESADISLSLFRKGTPLPAVDIMVAAMCIQRNFMLCTRDPHLTNIRSIRPRFRLQLVK